MASIAPLGRLASDEIGERDERNQVTALARGLQVLQCFTTSRKQLSASEIARLTGLPQPTVWRLCRTLFQAEFLVLAPESQKLQLGTSALALGLAATATFDILEIVRQRMQELADRFNAAITIAGRENLEMVYLQRCTAEGMVGSNLHRGSRLPLFRTTLGWAYLAALDERPRDRLLEALRANYSEEWPEMEALIAPLLTQFARKGFVLRRGLFHPEIIAVAVPIRSTSGGQTLAINCSAHAGRQIARTFECEVAPLLKELASMVGRSLASGSVVSANSSQTESGRQAAKAFISRR